MAGCIERARNGHISTSGIKSDVTIVFLDPDFLNDAKISAIRVHLRHIALLNICMGFQASWPKMGVLEGKKGKGWCDIDPPMNSFLPLRVLTFVPILVKIDQEMPPTSECPQTDRHTDANRFHNLSHAIGYSYGTDNKLSVVISPRPQ